LEVVEEIEEAGDCIPSGHEEAVSDDEAGGVSADVEDVAFVKFIGITGEVALEVVDVIAGFCEVTAGAGVVEDEDSF